MADNNWEQKKNNAIDLLKSLLDAWQATGHPHKLEILGPQVNNAVLSLEIDNINLPLPYDDKKMSSFGMLTDVLAVKDRSGGPDDKISKNITAWIELIDKHEPASNQTKTPATSDTKPIILDHNEFRACLDNKWYKLTKLQYDILNKLNKNIGSGFFAKQLKSDPRSDERPDKIIKRMPKAIQDRIKNTIGEGYHLI